MAQTSLRPKKTALLVAQRIVSDIARGGNRIGDRLPLSTSCSSSTASAGAYYANP
ncbi:UNVERIFIED_ORG: hypothetical protein FNL38_103125 [Nocardia globerula]|uniref:Uncharacterized protein n=1 Tax=Nocardia globerula TaxID=1818 RepID=A0A652YR35_NOCGL|nr:hypothetical protein [Rhodococcus globerulus]